MKTTLKYSIVLADRLRNPERLLEDSVSAWVQRNIALGRPLRSWECYAAMQSGAAKYPCSDLGLDKISALGHPRARQRWEQLFGDVCRDHKHQPIFPARKSEGSSTNGSVRFRGPQAAAQPQQKNPVPKAPQTSSPLVRSSMGDIS